MSVTVVLVAAGHGSRFGPRHRRPKQFRPLRGRPLVYWPLRVFEQTPSVRHVIIVVSREYIGWAAAFARRYRLKKVLAIVAGGAARADSVRAGVAAVPDDSDVVLIHDAARALVDRSIVERVAAATRRAGAALAAWPVPDTLKAARPGRGRRAFVGRTIPRDGIWLAQTPQGFRRDVLKKLFNPKSTKASPTDDAQLAERAGYRVELVPGSSANFKVTVPSDFKMCEALLR